MLSCRGPGDVVGELTKGACKPSQVTIKAKSRMKVSQLKLAGHEHAHCQ